MHSVARMAFISSDFEWLLTTLNHSIFDILYRLACLRGGWMANRPWQGRSGPSASIPKLRNSCWNVCNGSWGYLKHGITKDAYIVLQILAAITIFTKYFVHVAYGRDSIFLRRRGRSLLSTIALFYLPHELSIVIFHAVKKKAVASHHAERALLVPPNGIQARRPKDSLIKGGWAPATVASANS